MRTEYNNNTHVIKTGYFSAIFLAILTVITFAIAMTALPKSGPFCTGNCIDYPYLESLPFYPGDYYWMFLAMFQMSIWLIFMVSIHFIAPSEKRIYSFLSISFALISSIILFSDYFIQFAVVPVSLMKGETDGIALITQYNEHGIFIALEELGYLMMSLSFLFMFPVFSVERCLDHAIRWTFAISFILTVISFIFYVIKFGVDRSYRLEISVISINWLTLIIVSILTSVFFKRQLRLILKEL